MPCIVGVLSSGLNKTYLQREEKPESMEPVTKKPCIDVCEFNKKAVCKACGRTREEKKEWKQLSPDQKQAIWTRILESHGSGKGKNPRALRDLYEKAKKKQRKKTLTGYR
tara:strand:- start:1673 stop:2002 length:330 start_codon:yes stop_codon:yes gene_type:complete